jgi:outer membrane lipoprotein-sorting protein
MKKIIFTLLFFSISSFALSLDQVRADLKKSALSRDSVEMSIRTTVNTPAGKQEVSIYMVQKGTSKTYTEMKSSLLNQRSIVNGSRMKVIDLNTKKSQILPYNGEALEAQSYTKFNPLDSGDWQEPVHVSGNLYSIAGDKGTLYYDSAKKRIEKIESNDAEKNTLTTFTYDASDNLKKMEVSVIVSGIETKVTTEILALRSSAKFPDKLFEF